MFGGEYTYANYQLYLVYMLYVYKHTEHMQFIACDKLIHTIYDKLFQYDQLAFIRDSNRFFVQIL